MDDKFAKFHNGINNMRLKVIKAKDSQQLKGLSEPVITNESQLTKEQAKTQEKN
jgi:hypothetical protein